MMTRKQWQLLREAMLAAMAEDKRKGRRGTEWERDLRYVDQMIAKAAKEGRDAGD